MAKKTLKRKKEEKLTAIQAKRVIIAKDAILQLKAEKYIAQSSNCFVQLDYDSSDELEAASNSCELLTGKKAEDLELNKLLDRLITTKKPCTVCAKGALLISNIRKFNNFSVQKAIDEDLDFVASREIQEVFGKENADKIENYFERNDPYNDESDSQWSDQYPDDTERLIAILENVVKNKGDFKP